MENLVKEEIKEETIDIGTEFHPASSCNDEDKISRYSKDKFCNSVLRIQEVYTGS